MSDGAGISLPAQPSSVAVARRHLTARLTTQATDLAVAADAVLVVSELVTNAVLHGFEPIGIEVFFAGETLRIVVSDASPVLPAIRDYGDGASTGRGLALVASLARRWGVETDGVGKAIWVELDATSADGSVVGLEFVPSSTAGTNDDGTEAAPVRFLHVPVDVYLCLQQHNDDILRELELLSFSIEGRGTTVNSELTRIVERARAFFRVNREGFRNDVTAASVRGQRVVDLERVVVEAVVAPAEEMVSLFEDAERLGTTGQLLLGPPDAEVVHLRRWFVDEVRRQVIDGEEPAPYAYVEP